MTDHERDYACAVGTGFMLESMRRPADLVCSICDREGDDATGPDGRPWQHGMVCATCAEHPTPAEERMAIDTWRQCSYKRIGQTITVRRQPVLQRGLEITQRPYPDLEPCVFVTISQELLAKHAAER